MTWLGLCVEMNPKIDNSKIGCFPSEGHANFMKDF